MYFNNPPHITLQEAAKNDPDIAEAAKKIAAGELSLAAPCTSAENEWSDSDIMALDSILDEYYP